MDKELHQITHGLLLEIYDHADPETRAKISAEIEGLLPRFTGIKDLDDARSWLNSKPISSIVRRHHDTRGNALYELSYLHMAITEGFIPDWSDFEQEKWAITLQGYAITIKGAHGNEMEIKRPYKLARIDDWIGPESEHFFFFFPSKETAVHFMDVGLDLVRKFYMA